MTESERIGLTNGSVFSAVIGFVLMCAATTAHPPYFLGALALFFCLPIFAIIIKMIKRIWDAY